MNSFRSVLSLVIFFAMLGMVYEASATSSVGLCQIGETPTTTVSSASTLRDALANASAGTTIVVNSGNYRGDFTLSKSGTATNPITIRASGNVIFKDTVFELRGSYGVLTGMIFENGMASIFGDYNRVTGNVFRNGKAGFNTSKLHSAVHTEGGASYNRIDHNEVVNWLRRALRNTKIKSRTQGNRFDHNYVHDMLGPLANSGEAFQVGVGHADPQYSPGTIIEYNLVDGHNLENEVVSLKANGSIVRGNTFMNAVKGTIQARSSKDNLFINNTLINVQSLSIYGDHNKVIGNRLVNADIRVRSGDVLWPELLIKTPDGAYKYQGAHPTSRNTVVAGNVLSDGGLIELGKKGRGGREYYPPNYPVENTTLAQNTGGEVVTAGPVIGTQNLSHYNGNLGTPVQLTSSQVGPGSADPMCTGDVPPIAIALAAPQNLKAFVIQP